MERPSKLHAVMRSARAERQLIVRDKTATLLFSPALKYCAW